MPEIALALDVENEKTAYQILDEIDEKIIVKIGYSLFIRYGKDIVKNVRDRGFKIFLDLKLHDIPNTVYNGVKAATELQADYLTIHTLGGLDMIKKAVEAKEGSNLKLLGVTILTSHSEDYVNYIGSSYSLESLALKLAKEGVLTGLDGIVCSSHEVRLLKSEIQKPFIAVVPGIRLNTDSKDDQTRVATPSQAVQNGADILVIGRPILNSENKNEVIRKIKAIIDEAKLIS
ncbi:MAG: orotidine-5'-phosphate decarboxylase [Sulfurihydrogenibium sp.]|uniref:orotidine-5'-phosphate decarboxylase n=1 Tax=Sulfurihydrogenibium sp. TaxID=2053621 RepID=UPI000CC86B6D|nr:MAG: orotidine-5'-phosphate decarboxylase [Sulfurihydrogenibium sp.]